MKPISCEDSFPPNVENYDKKVGETKAHSK